MKPEGAAGDSRLLVDRASHGDPIAVAELLDRHLPGLRAYVRLRCGPMLRAKESASDIVQSACRDVLQNIDRFHYGGEAGFKSWLYEAATRKILDRAEYWRAAKRDPAREVSPHGGAGGGGGGGGGPGGGHAPDSADEGRLANVYRTMCTPSEVAMGREALARIERGFESLTEAEREVIVLSRIVGLSHAEISARLGCTEVAARLRLFRALAALAAALKDDAASGS